MAKIKKLTDNKTGAQFFPVTIASAVSCKTVGGGNTTLEARLASVPSSQAPTGTSEGDAWSLAVADLAKKAYKRTTGVPRVATADDYYDDPLGADSIVEGDYIFEVYGDQPPTVITWADTAHTLHVYFADEPCPNLVQIIRKNGGKVCIENVAYTRTSNVSNIGDNAIYEIQDSILSTCNLEAI